MQTIKFYSFLLWVNLVFCLLSDVNILLLICEMDLVTGISEILKIFQTCEVYHIKV